MLDANAMDFDDLLMRTVNVLELFEDVRRRYRERFRWVLVDEYQDTNRAQYRLLQLLAGEDGNLTVVGDEDQSIYGFRGADIRNILEFEHDFPDAAVVKLEQNYRSTADDPRRRPTRSSRTTAAAWDKHLWTDLGEGEQIHVAELEDEHDEARFVAGEIEELIDQHGVTRDEIAVFYRTNAHSRVLEDILVRYELPYQVIGGTKFYERAEIKDAIAYLQLLVNPADEVSFSRVINSPRRGIGDTSQGRLLAHANTTGRTIWEIALEKESVPGLSAAAMKSIGRFTELIEELRGRVRGRPGGGPARALLERSGYLDALRAERTIEAEGRMENLEELVGVAAEFDANREVEGPSELAPLEEFLQAISLYTDQDDLERDECKVTLMTLHNAKGLEYDAVFIIGCEEGVFPHSRSLEEGNEEEERRLCYVGITRARKRLWMTHARSRRLFAGRETGFPRASSPSCPTSWSSGRARRSRRSRDGRSAGRPGQPAKADPSLSFATGDDIVHASFGDGVVTAVEPGGVIVVRFASDGAERKLMADYAPLNPEDRDEHGRHRDRRQGGGGRRARARARRGRGACRRSRQAARPRHRAGRGRQGLCDLRPPQAGGMRGDRDPLLPPRAGRRRPPGGAARAGRRAQRLGRESTGSSSSCRFRTQVDADAIVNAHRPGQGRRRAHPDERGDLARGEPGLVACTPAGRHGAARARRASTRPARTRSSSAARTWSAGRSSRCCSPPTRP